MKNRGFWRPKPVAGFSLALLAICLQPVAVWGGTDRGIEIAGEHFRVAGRAVLDIEVNDADLALTPHDGEGIEVRVFAYGRDAEEEWMREVYGRLGFTARKQDNTIVIRAENPRIRRSEYRRNGSVWFEIKIAHPVSIDCRLKTGDGDVILDEIDGEVDIKTGDGDILVRNARGPSLSSHTGDGDIVIEAMNSKAADLHTGDGDISIEELSGSLTARTGDGDIDVRLMGPNDVTIETGDGDVLIRAPTSLRANVELLGEDVDVRGFELKGKLDDGRVRGQLNGGGDLLQIRTGDGAIVLRAI